jgi:type II secretory pathway pseudopilin PulG
MWRAGNDNSYVQLQGQGAMPIDPGCDRGYAMAALLVGLSIMAVLMGAALPVWNKQAQREREEEYLFRAHEYARGVMKFQRRAGPGTLPPSLDVLVQQRFVRRKYKDPLSGEDFQPVYQTVNQPGQPGSGAAGAARPGMPTPSTPPSGPGGVTSTPSTPTTSLGGAPTTSLGGTPTAGQGAPVPGAGVMGVVSKSKGSSIKVYNGRTRYDQWAVTYQDVRPGKGLPPDLIQALNVPGAPAQPGAMGQPMPGGANPFGAAQPGGAGQPRSPFGQPGANPFGQPGMNPPTFPPGGNPFGRPGTNPFGGGPGVPPGGPGAAAPSSPFAPAYPPPPGGGGSIFGGPPPRKSP